MKKVLAIILLAVVVCVMTACSFSSSSTSSVSVSSSVTDEEGNTETNTVSSEAEVSVGSDGVKVTAESTARRLAGGKSRDFNAGMAEKMPHDCIGLG